MARELTTLQPTAKIIPLPQAIVWHEMSTADTGAGLSASHSTGSTKCCYLRGHSECSQEDGYFPRSSALRTGARQDGEAECC